MLENNPRKITDFAMDKLVESILCFPEMLEIRPIVCSKEMVVLGGNQRLAALRKISGMQEDELRDRMMNQTSFAELDDEQQDEAVGKWLEWQKKPVAGVSVAVDFTETEESEFVIRDNTHYGRDDFNVLKENYEPETIEEWYGHVSQEMFDFGAKMNDKELDIGLGVRLIFKVGYVSVVMTDEEYERLTGVYEKYLELGQPEIGFINYLLC